MKLLDHDTEAASPVRRRRAFTAEFKRDLVKQTRVPGASVSAIALAHGLNTNQLFSWRRKLLAFSSVLAKSTLLPVRLDLGVATRPSPPVTDGRIELSSQSVTLTLHGRVDAETLCVVLQWLLP